jgi:hypothetical protein
MMQQMLVGGHTPLNDYGQVGYTNPGTYTWVAPAGVTSVCAVCVGGGAGGDNGWGTNSGGGGGLGWKNNILVTPGQSYTVVVGNHGSGAGQDYSSGDGTAGEDSYFISLTTVKGGGAFTSGSGGGYVGDGGGNGGNGVTSNSGDGGGGGGAAGYSGNGGDGSGAGPGGNGSGGGGGGGARGVYGSTGGTEEYAGRGGGVGINGEGASGTGGQDSTNNRNGTAGYQGSGVIYGGGGFMGPQVNLGQVFGRGGSDGGHGAVRIIWGPGRSFPIDEPTITITSPYNTVAYNSTMVIYFDLSENSTDFAVGDITVTNGSLSNFTGSGVSYSALFTPVATIGVTATISVASNSFSDAQGNFNIDGNDPNNSIDINIIANPVGQQAYTSAGTYQWTAPADVTSVCAVCVGGGGHGYDQNEAGSGSNNIPGGGGGLGWKNNIAVTPGQTYTVKVGGQSFDSLAIPGSANPGQGGGTSYFIDDTTVYGGGGGVLNYTGGGYGGDGGGEGGGVNVVTGAHWAGGGAGGYTGDGGKGGYASTSAAGAGSGGGGGGGGGTSFPAGGGGGVGIYGQGADGAAGSGLGGGGGGSGGTNGTAGSGGNGSVRGNGGTYGGGGGCGGSGSIGSGGIGGGGAVRIIWGSGRAFPSTNTTDQ